MDVRTPATDHGLAWHSLPASTVTERLEVRPEHGLDSVEAAARLGRHGPNRLSESVHRRPRDVLLAQYRNLPTAVLGVAAVLAGGLGRPSDMVVILAVAAFNGLLGYRQDCQARRIFLALQRSLAHHSRVRRAGEVSLIPSEGLVPGDVVLLEAGDRVPADGRLIAAHYLEIDQSPLTGEALPTAKEAAAQAQSVPTAERRNMAFMNTVVTRGRGTMVVTATGRAAEVARIAAPVADSSPVLGPIPGPLPQRSAQMAKRLTGLAIVLCVIYLGLGVWHGEAVGQVVMTSLVLVAAAAPEGLPAMMTFTLAIGLAQMARRGAIVTRMPAIEALGSANVICCDKTGTLTMNHLEVSALAFQGRRFRLAASGADAPPTVEAEDQGPVPDLGPLLTPALLCKGDQERADTITDPIETALLGLAGLQPTPPYPRLAEIPFDPDTRFMATYHRLPDGDVLVCVKGAPDAVLALCGTWLSPDGAAPLGADRREAIGADASELGGRGLRVLALASGRLSGGLFRPGSLVGGLLGLTFVGLAGLIDPPHPQAAKALAMCRRAGIAVKMITGDHLDTAMALARQLGMSGDGVSGSELDRMSQGELAERIAGTGVIARATPEHKLRVIEALRQRGNVVAVTGDGVNDAPALKAADIGIAMGAPGSDVAREAARVVLTEGSFATVFGAVSEGRALYDKIVNLLRYQLSTNMGVLLAVLAAPLLGLPTPFHPIHILWASIVMGAAPAIALAFDPAPASIMRPPPGRPAAALLPWRSLGRLAAYGGLIAVGTLAVFAIRLKAGAHLEEASTLAFTTFVLFQFFNLLNARPGGRWASVLDLVNARLWLALAGVLAVQVAVVQWGPTHALFHTTPLAWGDWALAFLVAASVSVLDALWRRWTTASR